ncbi:MAG: ATP-binding protein [Paracoccaceae bacterium]
MSPDPRPGHTASPEAREADALERIADALERLAPAPYPVPDFDAAEAWVWHPEPDRLVAVAEVARVDLDLLIGVERQRDVLMANTRAFAHGRPANNALLWGARGMGKSSLVKAVHAAVGTETGTLRRVEIFREDLSSVGRLLDYLRLAEQRFVLFCDDLSFEPGDAAYKSLKAVLDGGVAGRPDNVVVYATSNRRHLMPRDMIDNERSTAINPGEAVEEKVSLSDRFGLWLGFHPCDQDDFLAMVRGYARYFRLDLDDERLRAEAVAWRQARGAMSGRVAWQLAQDLAARAGAREG